LNSIWNKNIEAFKKRFPRLAEITGCRPVPPEAIWKLESARNGMITASEMGVRLHSAYNPEREADGAVRLPQVLEKSAVVFYGFGLGYHVINLARLAEEKKRIIIIEPDLDHFFAALSILDWTPVFLHENLVLAIGAAAEDVFPLIENSSSVNLGKTGVSDAYYFDIPAFTAHAKAYFDVIRSIIKRNQKKNEINAATLKKFGRIWCRNSVKNLDRLESLGSVSSLKGKIQKLPFLIIGAGPSLEGILPFIAKLQKQTVIICVETALHILLRNGVQPDFVILTDPQYWAYRHIAALKAPDSILIAELSVYPAVFRFNCRKLLLCSSQFPVGQFVEAKAGLDLGDLGSGGSVASSAWNFAYFCGAKRIYLAGLDFAFPGGQTHIKGSSAEQTYHAVSSRLAAADNFTAATLFNANAILSKDFIGQPVLTDSRMKMFSWWFESRLAGCPEVQTFTLCPQGLATPGIKVADIKELLSEGGSAYTEEKKAFIEGAEAIKPELSSCQIEKLSELKKAFNNKNLLPQDFINQYPFLKEYF